MLNKKFIIIASIFFVTTFCFVLLTGQTSIRLVNSTEIGSHIVVEFPSWVSEERAQDLFSIKPHIEGDLSWVDNKLYFIPADGFKPDVDYTVSISNKLLALLPLSRDRVIRVASASIQGYVRSQIDEERFIDVNLATMILSLYEDGKVFKTFPIAGKGHPKLSPTVEGEFAIKTKELNHFSTLAYVWMPYSMQFYGNYFIHAWPHWPNGNKLTSKYSGGCVRLFNADAVEVFAFARIGTPFIVHSTRATPIEQIKSGDLIKIAPDADSYLVKIVNGKYFKRVLDKGKFEEWYSHLSSENVKLVSQDVLDRFQTSRWVHLPGEIDIYELNPNRVKHFMACGDRECWDIWSIYGWDPDELYVVTEEELSYYRLGPEIDLPPAPWADI